MLKKQPTASAIRAANRNAVGGGRKRCRKGKNCSATCIDANKECLVGLPEPVSQATTKVAAMLQQRQGGGGASASTPTQPQTAAPVSLADLSKRIGQAREEYEDAYGTPNQAAAKAKFDKAVSDYEKAKDAQSGKPTAPSKPSRGLNEDQEEKVERAAAATDRRIEKRLNERQFYDDETNAKIKAANQEVVAPFQKMSADEKAALALYGQDGVQYYKQINQLLRSGQMEDSSPDKVKMAEFISNNLRTGLEKLPPAKVESLERAVSGNFVAGLGKLSVGDVIQDRGFGSYTDKGSPVLNQFIRSGQPNAVIQILNPKTIRQVAPVMEYNTEGEHISLPNTKYRLVSIQEKGEWSRKLNGYVPKYVFEEVIE